MPREAVLAAADSRQLVDGVFCTYKFSVAIDGGKKKNQVTHFAFMADGLEEPRRRAKSRVYGEATRATEHGGLVRHLQLEGLGAANASRSHTAQEKHRAELKRLKDIHAEQLAHALAAHVLDKAEAAGRLQRAHEMALIELKSQVRSLTSQVEGDQERVKEADKKNAVEALALKWESATAAATANLCAAQLARANVAIEAERGELSARCTALAAELSAARTAREAERKGPEAARVAFEAERAAVEAERDDLAARCAALESQHGELSTRREAGEARCVALEAHRAALLDDTHEKRLERATPTSDDVAQSHFRASVQTKSILAEILGYGPEISFRRIGMVITLCGLFVNNALASLQLLPRVRAELLAKVAPRPRTTATWVADMHAHAVSQLVLKMLADGNVAMSSDVGHKTCAAMAVLVHLMVPDGNGGKKPDYFLDDNAKVRGETGRSNALVLWTLLLMLREIAGAVDDATLERCGLSRTTIKLRGLAGDGRGIVMGAMLGTAGQLTALDENFIAPLAQCVHHDLSKMLETVYCGTVEEKFDIYKMSLLSTLKLMVWLQESVGCDVLKTLLVGPVDGVVFAETENWHMIHKVADFMYTYWLTAADRAEQWLGNKELYVSWYLWAALISIAREAQMKYAYTPPHKSMSMARFWACVVVKLRMLQDDTWKGHASFARFQAAAATLTADERARLEQQCNKALKLFLESEFARAVAGLMTAIAADCELSVDAIVSDPAETCSAFGGSRVNLRAAIQVILDCRDEKLRRYADERPGFGAGIDYGGAVAHLSAWHGRAGISAKLMTARTTGIALSRKAQREAVMALARKKPRLGGNVHVEAGKESERKRQDGPAAPAQVRRFEHTKASTVEFVTGAIARADAAATELGRSLAKRRQKCYMTKRTGTCRGPRIRAGETRGLTFKQKLKALPDVVTNPASKKSFLNRLVPSWEEDDADEDHAERFLAAGDVNPFGENDGKGSGLGAG
ncbi:hypothetical protein M885DRAFT_574154 [Pelagophyceae sp. CCMP2097]|nr:hypothetical protein M885DRAFT_574154 [Pelagophyceae sp. CCMP2097]